MSYKVWFLLGMFLVAASAQAAPSVASWNLPVSITDANTTVSFEVDSTWHMVHGTTSNLTGSADLAEQSNPQSVKVELSIPVSTFDTDWERRNRRMREVMLADKFPHAKFVGTGLTKGCSPALAMQSGSCQDVLGGQLTLLDTTKSVDIPVTIVSDAERNFIVTGNFALKWADYGIEDPSILIAKLDPIVNVHFRVTLPQVAEESS